MDHATSPPWKPNCCDSRKWYIMPKSSNEVPVIRVKLEDHPNADKLALVRIDDMRVVCVRKDEWKDGDLGAFIQADMVVPETADFEWLGKDHRIRPRKFRGLMSWGLLVPAPEGAKLGDDVAEQMGIVRYQPPESGIALSGQMDKAPSCYPSVYDLESYYKYKHLLQTGETVVVTEKIHGTNSRFVYWDNRMHAGSHHTWQKPGQGVYWKALEKYPQIEIFCRTHEGFVVYGEIFGKGIQDLDYGAEPGEIYFRVFDIRDSSTWLWVAYHDIYCCSGMPSVPSLYIGPYEPDKVSELISGKSVLAEHIREGIVVGPIKDRYDPEIGRVKLKAVSMEYLERRK